MKRKFIISLFCVAVGVTAVVAQQKKTHLVPVTRADVASLDDPKARAILDKAAAKYKTDIKINFKITLNDTKTGKKENMTGDVMMKGQKFKLSMNGQQTYYDGKYEYVYVAKNNEVTILQPTKKDLQEINPAFLLSSYTTNSTVQFSLDNKKTNPFYTIDVFPDHTLNKEYYKAIVKVNRNTMNVVSINVLSKNGVHTLFSVTGTAKSTYNEAAFTFYPKSHPGVIVNDLR